MRADRLAGVIAASSWITPNVPRELNRAMDRGAFTWEPMRTSYFISRDSYAARRDSPLPRWQARLFAVLTRLSSGARGFYRLPINQVVEMGGQMEV